MAASGTGPPDAHGSLSGANRVETCRVPPPFLDVPLSGVLLRRGGGRATRSLDPKLPFAASPASHMTYRDDGPIWPVHLAHFFSPRDRKGLERRRRSGWIRVTLVSRQSARVTHRIAAAMADATPFLPGLYPSQPSRSQPRGTPATSPRTAADLSRSIS